MRMDDPKQQIARGQIRSVTNFGIVCNTVLFVLKLSVGFLAGSIALIADRK
jgi:divalent metal cation (Fe/Co/Zn/Cd) transporter